MNEIGFLIFMGGSLIFIGSQIGQHVQKRRQWRQHWADEFEIHKAKMRSWERLVAEEKAEQAAPILCESCGKSAPTMLHGINLGDLSEFNTCEPCHDANRAKVRGDLGGINLDIIYPVEVTDDIEGTTQDDYPPGRDNRFGDYNVYPEIPVQVVDNTEGATDDN